MHVRRGRELTRIQAFIHSQAEAQERPDLRGCTHSNQLPHDPRRSFLLLGDGRIVDGARVNRAQRGRFRHGVGLNPGETERKGGERRREISTWRSGCDVAGKYYQQ